jgi:Tfp pilus assembly protein FimV
MPSRVQWFQDRVVALTTTIPQRAHDLAAAQAAGFAARAAQGRGTGAMARDVSRPRRLGTMRTLVGSSRIYAGIQNRGGTITAKRGRMLIRGNRGGSARSTAGGAIVASATEVTIPGKHFLEVARAAFPRLFVAMLRRLMPR